MVLSYEPLMSFPSRPWHPTSNTTRAVDGGTGCFISILVHGETGRRPRDHTLIDLLVYPLARLFHKAKPINTPSGASSRKQSRGCGLDHSHHTLQASISALSTEWKELKIHTVYSRIWDQIKPLQLASQRQSSTLSPSLSLSPLGPCLSSGNTFWRLFRW